MTTPILQIEEVASGQVNQYLIYNTALRKVEAALNAVLELDLSSEDAAVTNTDTDDYAMLRYGVFKATGNAVGRVVTFSANERQFVVHNAGTASLDVTIGATTVAVPASTAYRFYADGTTDGLVRVE